MAQVTVNVCYRTKLFKVTTPDCHDIIYILSAFQVSCCPQETIGDIVHKVNADSL